MRFGILGTGTVARTLGERLIELGHDVTLGSRTPEVSMVDAEQGRSLQTWLERAGKHGGLASLADAGAFGDMLINATPGYASLGALSEARAAGLRSRVLIDVANALDFATGGPSLINDDSDSLGEQIQRAFPHLRVVKTLNTVSAPLMVAPWRLANGKHSVFLSGNNEQAKHDVRELLYSFGWRDIIDLGDITTARAAELYLALAFRLATALGSGLNNIRVVCTRSQGGEYHSNDAPSTTGADTPSCAPGLRPRAPTIRFRSHWRRPARARRRSERLLALKRRAVCREYEGASAATCPPRVRHTQLGDWHASCRPKTNRRPT